MPDDRFSYEHNVSMKTPINVSFSLRWNKNDYAQEGTNGEDSLKIAFPKCKNKLKNHLG